jgi:transposase-like protein
MNDLEQMVADMWMAGSPAQDIARRAGIGKDAVYSWVKRFGLPADRRVAYLDSERNPNNPSPEQIEVLKRELREQHYAKRRAETHIQTDSRVSKERERLRA